MTVEFHIQGWYGQLHGWETLTVEDNREDAEQMLADYDANEPGVRHRIKRVRS